MARPAEVIETEAMALSEAERVRLAMHLLESVESIGSIDLRAVEQAWLDESERRYRAYLAGKEIAVPAEEAFRTLRDEDN